MKKTLFLLLFGGLFMSYSSIADAQDAYIGEIRLLPYSFAPENWLECKGQMLTVSDNTALFAVLGNRYGGDGYTTFAIPDLRGRVAIHPGVVNGKTVNIGATGGTESETMTVAQLPFHTHSATALSCSAEEASSPSTGYYAVNPARGNEFNSSADALSAPVTATINSSGSSAPRSNIQPYTTMVWCICVNGIFPPRD